MRRKITKLQWDGYTYMGRQGIKLAKQVKLVKALVFPAETWTMRKAERKNVGAFEMWCGRRVMRVSWMERKTNVWALENIKTELRCECVGAQVLDQLAGALCTLTPLI